jgi:DNA-directed RNA polymerase specialized sigma24 family protein
MSSPACQSPSGDSTRACEASAIERDADAVVGTLVRTLSRDERLLLCLRYADGLADEEIAALTRMAVDEVRRSIAAVLDRARSLVGSVA